MTLSETLQLAATALAAMAGLAAFVSSLRNKSAIADVHVLLNSRLSELILLAGQRGENVGRAAERADVATELAAARAPSPSHSP